MIEIMHPPEPGPGIFSALEFSFTSWHTPGCNCEIDNEHGLGMLDL